MVNEQMQFFLRGFRRDAHPMAIMTGLVGAESMLRWVEHVLGFPCGADAVSEYAGL